MSHMNGEWFRENEDDIRDAVYEVEELLDPEGVGRSQDDDHLVQSVVAAMMKLGFRQCDKEHFVDAGDLSS